MSVNMPLLYQLLQRSLKGKYKCLKACRLKYHLIIFHLREKAGEVARKLSVKLYQYFARIEKFFYRDIF